MAPTDLVTRFWNLFSDQRWEDAQALLSPDLLVEWPQSRERMRGPENFVAVNRHYPGNHKIEILRIYAVIDTVITTVWIEADTGQKTFATSYFEVRDGRIARIEEYWAEPYPAPEWRRKWVESY
jgi:ketosteroid isomerase-like protein